MISSNRDVLKKRGVITMGGQHSNHLFAIGGLCHEKGIPLTALVRGEKSSNPGYVVQQLTKWGVDIQYVDRTQFRLWRESGAAMAKERTDALWVPEGGSNGATNDGFRRLVAEWYDQGITPETSIVMASGTGGTLAGMLPHFKDGQRIILINAVPGFPVGKRLEKWAKESVSRLNIQILETNHLGKFARVGKELYDFSWQWQERYNIPLDPVYTARVVYILWEIVNGVHQEITGEDFSILHTGGHSGAVSWEKVNQRSFTPAGIRPDISR